MTEIITSNKLIWYDNDGIHYSAELLAHKEWKAIYATDKHSAKPSFNKWLTYLYFAYSRTSERYKNYLPHERKQLVCINIINEQEDAWIDLDRRLESVIPDYINSQYEPIEHMMLKLINDMDSFVKYLNEIPFEIDKSIKVAEKETMIISVPNIEEKMKAMKAAGEIMRLKDEYDKMIKKELKSASVRQRRYFEDPKE